MLFSKTILSSVLVASAMGYSFNETSWTSLKATGTVSGAITSYSGSFAIAVVPVTTGTWTSKATSGAAQQEASSILAKGGNKAAVATTLSTATASASAAGSASGTSGALAATFTADSEATVASSAAASTTTDDGSDDSDDSSSSVASDSSDSSDSFRKRQFNKRKYTVLERRDDSGESSDDTDDSSDDTGADSDSDDSASTAAASATASASASTSATASATDSASATASETASETASASATASETDSETSATSTADSDSDDSSVSDKGTSSDPISTVSCAKTGTLSMTLKDGILEDSKGRIGAIVSNRQFQFDGPPQAGTIYANGWSITKDGYLAIGSTETFYRCLSGTFYNLYDQNVAYQCTPIKLLATGIKNC